MAAAHPGEQKYQSDLAICCNDSGNLYGALGRPDDALRLHRQALGIREKLALSHPDKARLQNELAKSYANVASVLDETGHTSDALTALDRARALNESILRSNLADFDFASDLGRPNNTRRAVRRDLAFNLRLTGYIYGRARNHEKALRFYRDAVAQLEVVVHEDAADLEAHSELAGCWFELGYRAFVAGDFQETRRAYEKAHTISERLVAENPGVSSFLSQFGVIQWGLAELSLKENRPKEAFHLVTQALATQEKLVRSAPESFPFQSQLAYLHRSLARLHAADGKPEEALRAFQKAQAIDEKYAKTYPRARYNLACDLALRVPLIASDKPEAERAQERQKLADLAMQNLRAAITAGYKHPEHIATDEDLRVLRERDDFKQLSAEVKSGAISKPN